MFVDMNLSPRRAAFLDEAGIQAVHWSSIGAFDAPDVEIMTFARDHDCVVLTHDLDFSAILAATAGGKPSVVQIRGDALRPDTVGSVVVDALGQLSDDLEAGALLAVDTVRTRVRVLPLPSRS